MVDVELALATPVPKPLTVANEAELMRTCGHLYLSIALESFATTLMACIFSYLLLLITNKGRLKNPGKAFWTFLKQNAGNFYNDLCEQTSKWKEMPDLPLADRFAMCRKVNQAVCMFQILIAFLTIERWMHINNVNGFRYLGYSMTCPPMQAQLVVLIAPVVPCYKLNCYLTYFLTMIMLLFGYAASVMPGDLWDGEMLRFVDTWDLDDLRPRFKFWFTFTAACIQTFLSFVQIPYLYMVYKCRGGLKAGLPHGYPKLLGIVAITWLAFPCWWALSFEGMSIIKDTKMNAAGFAILNVVSKGSFTLHMLSIVKWHRREKERQEWIKKGLQPGRSRINLFSPEPRPEPEEPEEDPNAPPKRKEKRQETWVVSMLRRYDQEEEATQEWQELDPTYRAFLVGNSITPSNWREMDADKRRTLHDNYENTFDMVLGNDAGAIKPEKPVRASQVDKSKDDRKVTIKSDPSVVAATAGSSRSGWSEQAEDEDHAKMQFRVGQTLTSFYGQSGRVLKVTPTDVHLSIPGQQRPEVVSKGDITILKVSYMGVRGLRLYDRQLKLACGCMVSQRPCTEVLTPSGFVSSSRATWDYHVEVLGYSPGDGLEFRLYGTDENGEDSELGKVELSGEELEDGGFDGELQLYDEEGEGIRTYLNVAVVAANLPGSEEAEEFTVPGSRVVHPGCEKANFAGGFDHTPSVRVSHPNTMKDSMPCF